MICAFMGLPQTCAELLARRWGEVKGRRRPLDELLLGRPDADALVVGLVLLDEAL